MQVCTCLSCKSWRCLDVGPTREDGLRSGFERASKENTEAQTHDARSLDDGTVQTTSADSMREMSSFDGFRMGAYELER